MPSQLAVLEARWESRGNYGVRQLFELISAVITYNPHAHRYDMFSDTSSFRDVLSKIGKSKRFQAVYIGSHGQGSGMKNEIRLEDVVESLRHANGRGNIRGMYFGVCSLAKLKNVSELLAPSNDTNLQWVAGYSKDIDWLESSAADLLFWSGYLHSNSKVSLAKAVQGTKNLLKFMPRAQDDFGFGAFKWSRDRRQVEPLLKKD